MRPPNSIDTPLAHLYRLPNIIVNSSQYVQTKSRSFKFVAVFAGLLAAGLLLIAAKSSSSDSPHKAKNAAPAEAGAAVTPEVLSATTSTPPTAIPTQLATPQPKNPSTPTPRPSPIPMNQQELDKLILPNGAASHTSDAISLIYNSYRRSQLEPCGCVAHQLGGIDREARLIERLKELNIPQLKVDAGSWLRDVPSENIILQTRSLLGALAEIHYDVLNVSFVDLSAGLKFVQDEAATHSLSLVSANILDPSGKPIFEPYRIINVKLKSGQDLRVGVLGITRPSPVPMAGSIPDMAIGKGQTTTAMEFLPAHQIQFAGTEAVLDPACRPWVAAGAEAFLAEPIEPMHALGGEAAPETAPKDAYTFGDPTAALKQYLPEVRSKCDIVVLLDYESRDAAAHRIASLGPDAGITVIVAGEFLSTDDRVTESAGAKIVTGGFEGKQVGHLLFELRDHKISWAENHLMEVLQSIPPLPRVTRYIDQYKEATKSLAVETPVTAARITYAGKEACASCHAREYKQWETTKHAQAMHTLIAKNSQFNPECLKCHTTGYKIDNGFVDYRSTPNYADVQCEVCHGGAYDHVVEKRKAQIMASMGKAMPPGQPVVKKLNRTFSERFCSQCHDPENDNRFNYSRDINLVNHLRIAQRPANAPVTRQTSGTATRDRML